MKKLLAFLFAFLLFPFVMGEKPESKDVKFIEKGDYFIPYIENASYAMKEGYPVTPYFTKTYVFPFGTEIKGVDVKVKNIEEMKLEKKIMPSPPPSLLNEKFGGEAREGEIYSEDIFYPEKWFDYRMGAGIKDGKHVVFLSVFIYPMRYNAVRNKIIYARDFDINIDYEVRQTATNNMNGDYDLLIIAPDDWMDELKPLKEHKEQHGVKTIIVGLNEIYSGEYFATQGRDEVEKIKYFIKDAIEEWGIEYVMLVGDADKMPVRYIYTSIEDLPYVPCDLYYADIYSVGNIFSSWDDDGDEIYGERGDDSPDLFPDIYIARLPASNEYELQTLIDKIINYKTPPMKALLVGVELFWETDTREGEYLKERIREDVNNIDAVRLYETDEYEKDGSATAEEIAYYINRGVMFVNFASHGYPEGMGWESGWWSVNELNLLHNNYLPVVFAMSCSTNQFDTTDCLGEEFLLYENGGAIAYAGSSRVAFVYTGKSIASSLSGYLDKAFFKAYYDGSRSVGEMFSTAKISYLTNIPFMGTHDVLTLTEYNIMGDPSIMLPSPPMTSKAYTNVTVSNEPIKIWVDVTEENSTIDLYYRKRVLFGGRWQLYGSKNAPPYEWEFMPDDEGYYEFYSILKKGNYTENPPDIADAYCIFKPAPPSVNITKPEKGKLYIFNKEVACLPLGFTVVIGSIDVEAKGKAEYMEIYIDDELVFAQKGNEIAWKIDDTLLGRHTIRVAAYNIANEERSEEVKIWAVIL